jgi:hypothetical protein
MGSRTPDFRYAATGLLVSAAVARPEPLLGQPLVSGRNRPAPHDRCVAPPRQVSTAPLE